VVSLTAVVIGNCPPIIEISLCLDELGSKRGCGKAFVLCSVAGLCATGAGGAKLLVEGFLGLCSGVQQDLPRGDDRGLKLRL
jgi:hypothetical protein